MALLSYYDIGSASIENGETVVNGTGTQWLTALRQNDIFVGKDGRSVRVASIDSATSLTLARPWPGDSQTDDAYEVRITPAPSEITASVRELLEKLRQGLWLTPNATGTLAERAGYDSARRGFIYMQTDVDPFVVFVKQTDTAADWSPGFSPQQGPSGPYTTIEIGSVTTVAPDQPATIDAVQSGETVTLNFNIPRGPTGDIDGVTPFWVTRLGSDADQEAARAGLDVPSNEVFSDGIDEAKERANHTGTQAIGTIEGLQDALFESPYNLAQHPTIVRDSQTDNTLAIIDILAVLKAADYAGAITIPSSVRFRPGAIMTSIPFKAFVEAYIIVQPGPGVGYLQMFKMILDNPENAATDTAVVHASGHYADFMTVVTADAGTTSGLTGLQGISQAFGFFKDGAGGPRVMMQHNYVRSPERTTEFNNQGIGCWLIRSRVPWHMRDFESWRLNLPAIVGTRILAPNGYFYQATTAGDSTIAPTHTTGTVTVGGVSWAFMNGGFVNFGIIDYRDDYGRNGNRAVPTGLFFLQRQHMEDTETSMVIEWQSTGLSKRISQRMIGRNASGTALTTAWEMSALGVAEIGNGSNNHFMVYTNGQYRVRFNANGNFEPANDDTYGFGTANARWYDAYIVRAIQTSDAREKTTLTALSEAEIAAACELSLNIGSWMWLTDVAADGAGAKLHIGITVQRALGIMRKHGLNPWAYDMFRYDAWGSSPAVYDGRGLVSQPARLAGDRFSLIPVEFLMFIAAGFAAHHQQTSGRLDAIEAASAA